MTKGDETRTRNLILIMLAAWTALCGLEAAPISWETKAMEYLVQHGYQSSFDLASKGSTSKDAISAKAISNLQIAMGINATGKVDVKTAQLMSLPSCGVKDDAGPHQGIPWPRKNLTYKIVNRCRTINRRFVDEEIARAFAVCSNYTDLTFSPTSEEVDIEISFGFGNHDGKDPFDEPTLRPITNQLAHVSFAKNMTKVHFDNFKLWTVESYHGYNLFQVAVHEFGHVLGLVHNKVHAAVMNPLYTSYDPDFNLHEEDAAAVQALYGPKTNTRGPDLCEDPRFDVIFNTTEGHVYVFKGKYCWRLKPKGGIAAGYPQLISAVWKGLPSNIKAAFTYRGWTYFFKDSMYWAYIGRQKAGSYPREIEDDFHRILLNITAATIGIKNDQMYLFKGEEMWIFSHTEDSIPFTNSNVKLAWDVAKNANAVLSSNDTFYFFNGDDYYENTSSTGPFKTGPRWFGCASKNTEFLSNPSVEKLASQIRTR